MYSADVSSSSVQEFSFDMIFHQLMITDYCPTPFPMFPGASMRRSRHFMTAGTNQKIEIGTEISLHHTFAVQTLITAGR
jgi:hypothetical protein